MNERKKWEERNGVGWGVAQNTRAEAEEKSRQLWSSPAPETTLYERKKNRLVFRIVLRCTLKGVVQQNEPKTTVSFKPHQVSTIEL